MSGCAASPRRRRRRTRRTHWLLPPPPLTYPLAATAARLPLHVRFHAPDHACLAAALRPRPADTAASLQSAERAAGARATLDGLRDEAGAGAGGAGFGAAHLYNKGEVFEGVYQAPRLLRLVSHFLGDDATIMALGDNGIYGTPARSGWDERELQPCRILLAPCGSPPLAAGASGRALWPAVMPSRGVLRRRGDHAASRRAVGAAAVG